MDLLTSEKIIGEYGQALIKASKMSFGAPESMLPYKKNEIKDAIKFQLSIIESVQELGKTNLKGISKSKDILPEIISKIKDTDPKYIESLIAAYTDVAKFISDKDAEIASKFEEAVVSRDTKHEGLKNREQTSKIMEKWVKEEKKLLEEILNYLAKASKK